MEAGNRCKDECLPEETNRRIVDVISDVNMCYSEFARKYLADTGLPKSAPTRPALPHGGGAAHESGENSEKRCAGASGAREG